MATALQIELTELRRRLKVYVSQAYQNEKKQQRFQEQELQFISASGLEELIEALLYKYRDNFSLDAVTLLLHDPEFEIRHILENLDHPPSEHPGLLFYEDAASINQMFPDFPRPHLRLCDEACANLLFPGQESMLKSTAVFPLIRNQQLIGTLNMGSSQEQRFINGAATDFLERLTSILAVCLENTLNHERLKLLGLLDPLTGVHNRRYFDERLEEEVSRVSREGRPLSCLFLDIDFFKQFNDSFGHHVGDSVLQKVAATIKSHMRASDILARFGGEEFSVLLINTDIQEALVIAERIRRAVAEQPLVVADDDTQQVTISIGCSVLESNHPPASIAITSQALVERADKALYQAKSQGRNRVDALFSPE